MLQKITWPIAFLIAWFAALLFAAFILLPVYGIMKGWVPPSFLFAPIGSILLTAATGAAFYFKGKNEMPSLINDPNLKKFLFESMTPPPMPPSPPPIARVEGEIDVKVDQ